MCRDAANRSLCFQVTLWSNLRPVEPLIPPFDPTTLSNMLRSLMVFSCLGLLAQAKRCDLLHRSVHRGHRNHPQDEQANTTLSASDESDGGYASSPAQPSFASGGYSGQASYKSSTAVDAPTFSQDAETASASASGSAGSSNSSDAATSGGMDGFPKRLYIDFSSASKGSDAERLLK